MTNAKNPVPDPEDFELLLPWLATGRLEEREGARLAAALEQDPERARRYELVREELAETIWLNETSGAPSGRAAAQLFARIDAEGSAPRPLRRRVAGLAGWLRSASTRLGPAPRAWIAVAAAAVIVTQAGFLTALVVRNAAAPASYQTASGPQAGLGTGSFALIGFAPDATAAQIASLLQNNQASIVEGPRGGLFTIRLADRQLPREEVERVLARMRETSSVVLFAAPRQP